MLRHLLLSITVASLLRPRLASTQSVANPNISALESQLCASVSVLVFKCWSDTNVPVTAAAVGNCFCQIPPAFTGSASEWHSSLAGGIGLCEGYFASQHDPMETTLGFFDGNYCDPFPKVNVAVPPPDPTPTRPTFTFQDLPTDLVSATPGGKSSPPPPDPTSGPSEDPAPPPQVNLKPTSTTMRTVPSEAKPKPAPDTAQSSRAERPSNDDTTSSQDAASTDSQDEPANTPASRTTSTYAPPDIGGIGNLATLIPNIANVTNQTGSDTAQRTSSASKLPIGAIIGGAIGAIVAIGIILLAAFYIHRNAKAKEENFPNPPKEHLEYPVSPTLPPGSPIVPHSPGLGYAPYVPPTSPGPVELPVGWVQNNNYASEQRPQVPEMSEYNNPASRNTSVRSDYNNYAYGQNEYRNPSRNPTHELSEDPGWVQARLSPANQFGNRYETVDMSNYRR